jgi:dienelactone hydrolase
MIEKPDLDNILIKRDIPFTSSLGTTLCADFYIPAEPGREGLLPAVVFVSGDSGPGRTEHGKDSAQYHAWGRRAAYSGMIGITFDHHSTDNLTQWREVLGEVEALIDFVRAQGKAFGIDVVRLAIWTASAGPVFALPAVFRQRPAFIKCIVAYYGWMDLEGTIQPDDPPGVVEAIHENSLIHQMDHEPQAICPMLLVRAGGDRAEILESIDQFVDAALQKNLDLRLINYPSGKHGFDNAEETPETRWIIHETVGFLRRHLGLQP